MTPHIQSEVLYLVGMCRRESEYSVVPTGCLETWEGEGRSTITGVLTKMDMKTCEQKLATES
jgi:hypothetical protein